MKHIQILSLLAAFSALTLSSCQKNTDIPASENLSISGISPDTGPFNTTVTITGTGFSTNTADDKVRFNDSDAVVQSATPTQLVVLVPRRAGTGPVTLSAGSNSTTGPVFNYIYTYTVSTVAGNGIAGFANGNGSTAEFNDPNGLTVDTSGNIYVADAQNYDIRKITPDGTASTFAGPDGRLPQGFINGTGSSVRFNFPMDVAADAAGNIYVADYRNNSIRKITANGLVSTLAGNVASGHADGAGTSAQFFLPEGIAVDGQGNVYVAEYGYPYIRKITATGMVSTLAGNGMGGFADGSGSSAEFYKPKGVAVDAEGNVYVADAGNNRIRKITTSGEVSTLAGDGTASMFSYPSGVALDAQGNLYVADAGNNRICKISSSGIIIIAGDGKIGYLDGTGTAAEFNNPDAIAVDAQGNLYVGDDDNNRIRKITVE